tara:strand:- start:341 stop:1219 length:879 start_codon:yes stop_codon:yes gene_type:complete
VSKVNPEDELHMWMASGFFGDAMIDLCKGKRALENKNQNSIVIHTAKRYWHPNKEPYWIPANQTLLSFFNSIDFVKGIIFDVDQGDLHGTSASSNYNVEFPEYFEENWVHDITENINFELFTNRISRNYFNFNDYKIAVIQPISYKNKPKDQFEDYYLPVWNKTIESLKSNNYKIILIGGDKDEEIVRRYYPKFTKDNEILNLINKLTFFESLDLIWNHSNLNISCCSWLAWYSKAAGIPTAMASGYDMLHDLQSIRSYKLKVVGNDYNFFMDYANKKEGCDNSIADWINKD